MISPKLKAEIDERLADYRHHFPCTEIEAKHWYGFARAIPYLKSLNLIIPFQFTFPEHSQFKDHHLAQLAQLKLSSKSQIRDALLSGLLHQPSQSIIFLKRLAHLTGLPSHYENLSPLRKKLHRLNHQISSLQDQRDLLQSELDSLHHKIRQSSWKPLP